MSRDNPKTPANHVIQLAGSGCQAPASGLRLPLTTRVPRRAPQSLTLGPLSVPTRIRNG